MNRSVDEVGVKEEHETQIEQAIGFHLSCFQCTSWHCSLTDSDDTIVTVV
jgi:hypothetical protein